MKQVETLEELEAYNKIECACEVCRKFCEFRPCWGTPEEIKRLIESGFGGRLMLDWFSDETPAGRDILILTPAIMGAEGQPAPFSPLGKCTFLKNNLCEIHHLKPIEGRASSHLMRNELNKTHLILAKCWETAEAQALIEYWRKVVLCDGLPSGYNGNLPPVFEAFNLLKDLSKLI